MTISLGLVLWVLTLHYVGDWLCQTEWQALNKSSSDVALTAHVFIYTCILWFGTWGCLPITAGHCFRFVLLNGAIHWWTDYFTSRQVARLWDRPSKRGAFKWIGADQLAHQVTLIVTAAWLLT